MSARYEWYQTEQKVVVTVLIKNAADKNCIVNISSDRVSVVDDSGTNLQLDLLHNINASESNYKISPIKIEINLKKLAGDRWTTLIKTGVQNVPAAPMATVPSDAVEKTVSANKSSIKPKDPKDWDKVVNEIWTKEDLEKVNE